MALIIISKRAVEEEIRRMPSKECFIHLELSDWELQKQVLQKIQHKRILSSVVDKIEELDISKSKNYLTKFPPTFLFSNPVTSPKIDLKSHI